VNALCLIGPTGSGKTAAALAFAHEHDCEIISVDSALIYRGMDIGTAKPTRTQRAAVPHHLIDTHEPDQSYSAADFTRDAQRISADIRARGKTPLLVGGTMLYISALMGGIDDLPTADPALRAAIDAQARAEGWPALHALLAQHDPVTAARLSPNDSQRIQRALEVFQLAGTPLSAHFGAQRPAPPHLTVVALDVDDRAWLHQRIEDRLEAMLDDGLIEEVQSLRARGDLHPALPSMRCVGYRQVWQALDAGLSGAPLREAVRASATAATRQLAKRQITWLRRFVKQQWINERVACDKPDALTRCVAALVRHQSQWTTPT
jgi:tRNA dimethylallyltransferase